MKQLLKNNFLKFIVILLGVVVIYFLRTNFSEYNLGKSISACVVAQKQTSKSLEKSFDLKQSKKFCEEEIKKSLKD